MRANEYVTLGRSGLRVSPWCLGTMTFGEEWGWGSSVEDSMRVIDAYRDAGGNFLDTANIYTKGHSEAIIGDYMKSRAGLRDRLVVATKFMGGMFQGDPNGGGAGRKSVMAACEESLRRLKTDYIDLYWMHFYDDRTPIDETARAIDDLVRQGKIRYFGISDTPAWVCVQFNYEALFRNWTPAIALQIEYSLYERTVEHDLLPMARKLGMGVTPWSPLKGGLLTGKYTRENMEQMKAQGRGEWVANHANERAFTIIDELVKVADEVGSAPARVALSWVGAQPGVGSVIIGARTIEQLTENLAAGDLELAPEHMQRLAEASKIEPVFPHGFLPFTKNVVQGGTTVNGSPSEPWHMAPATDHERW